MASPEAADHEGLTAPAVGFEPTTNRLTADRSTTELRWISARLRLSADSHFVRISAAGKRFLSGYKASADGGMPHNLPR